MEDILKDFLAETGDQIEAVGAQLVQFEREPSDGRIIASIFRLVHSIKGTCGFLGLPRLANLAHSAETLIGRLRDGAPATRARVSLILAAIDRIKQILNELEQTALEPEGSDSDLINAIENLIGDESHDGDDGHEDERPVEAARPPAPAPVAERDETAPPPEAPKAVAPAPHQQGGPATIRVAVGALERIMTLVSELVLTRNQLIELTRHKSDEALKPPLMRLSSLTTDLQDSVMRARMQPIGRLFANLPRLVRELSADLDKKIDLIAEGSDTEIDRQLIELIRDPLTHMIRNCADHGLETPAERVAAGKPEVGVIRVCASHEAGYIIISISDDGRGLNVDRIREKAHALGLASPTELERMSNDMLARYIFAPGFSTASKVTSVSGRGVGMDVVRENIEQIGGSVSLATTLGRGTTFTLKIPLTLAIAPALIIETGGHRFALPQSAVLEAVGIAPDGARIENVQGARVLRLRDRVLPIAGLGDFLGLGDMAREPDEEPLVVVMRVGSVTFGVIVDGVSDVQEIVVKPLGPSIAHLSIFSGNTILGDGSVVLILDPLGLARAMGVQGVDEFSVAPAPAPFELPAEPRRLILFRAGKGAMKVVPLSLISRIESVSAASIARADGTRVIHHKNGLMPLIDAGDMDDEAFDDVRPVLVIGVGGELMGLLVSEIIDIVEDEIEIEIAGNSEAIIGSSIIRGEPAEILDITWFMKRARPGAFSRGHARRFRVLLVDDKLFFRDMLAPIVSAAGYDVYTAASARESLQLMDKGARFDAIVTDIDMPDMDGYAFARELQSNPDRAGIPMIALAAHAAQAVQTASLAAGMRCAVGKFDRAALVNALSSILESSAFNNHAIESRIIAGAAA